MEISGKDLDAESTKMLQQMATDITDEYKKEVNPGPTQLLYDTITDRGEIRWWSRMLWLTQSRTQRSRPVQ